MPVDRQTLQSMETLSDFSEEELEQIAPLAEILPVIESEILAQKGADAKQLLVVVDGGFMVAFEGGRATTAHSSGAFLGISALVSPFTHEATTTALTQGKVVSIPAEALRDIIEARPPLKEAFMVKILTMREERERMLAAT